MYNKSQLSRDLKAAREPKRLAKPKDIDYVSKMGYRDDSPFNDRPYIDIFTPNGTIDMSATGIPLIANGQYLPPYSGIHQFDTDTVREMRLAEDGGEYMDLDEDEIAAYRAGGYVVEELPKAQNGKFKISPFSYGDTPGMYQFGSQRPTFNIGYSQNFGERVAKNQGFESFTGDITAKLPYTSNTGVGVEANLKAVGRPNRASATTIETDLSAGWDPNVGPYSNLIASPQFTFGNVNPRKSKLYSGDYLAKVGPYIGASFTPKPREFDEYTSSGSTKTKETQAGGLPFGVKGGVEFGLGKKGIKAGLSGYLGADAMGMGLDPAGEELGGPHVHEAGIGKRFHAGAQGSITVPIKSAKDLAKKVVDDIRNRDEQMTSSSPSYENGGVYSDDIMYPPKHNPANSFAVNDPRSMQPGGGVKYTVDPRNPNVRIYNDKYAYNLAKKAEQDSSAAYNNYRNNMTPPAFTYDERNWAGMRTGNKVKPKPSDKDVKHVPASVGHSMVRNKYTWQGIQNNADRMDDYDYKCYEGDPRVCEKGLVPEFRGIKPSGYDVIDWTYPTGNKSRAVVSVFDKPKIKNIYREPAEPTPPSKGQKSPQTTAKVKTSNESKPSTEFDERWGNNIPQMVKVDYPTDYSIKSQHLDENGNTVTETIYYDKPQVDKLPFRPLPNVTYPDTPDLNLPEYELIKRYNQDQNKWIVDEALSDSPEAQQYRAAESWRLQNPQTRNSSHAVTQEEKQAYEDRKNRVMKMIMGLTGGSDRITQNKLNTLDLKGETFAYGGQYNIGDEVDEDTYNYLKSIGYEFE